MLVFDMTAEKASKTFPSGWKVFKRTRSSSLETVSHTTNYSLLIFNKDNLLNKTTGSHDLPEAGANLNNETQLDETVQAGAAGEYCGQNNQR